MEQLSSVEREAINDELREYKRKIDYGIVVAQLTTQGIKKAEIIEVEPTEEVITIPAYDFTEEEYQEFLQRKRKAELEKPKWREER